MLIDGATVDLEQENQRLQAELRAQTQELRGSRARLIAVGDAERRERDLHDGAQSKHAGAGLVAVDVRVECGRLLIDVTDDGCGGASVGGGSGLSGLADRVGALDGRVEIESPLSRPVISSPCRRFLRGG
jgi:hypothetical protein